MPSNTFTTVLLNWFSNPYHAPILIGENQGFYKEAGLDIAIIQPTNPSDVTKIVGQGQVDIALKAMIHTIAGRARGYPIVSVATLLDEPITGLIFLKSSGIKSFSDIKGKKLGFIGHFGEIIIDNLASHAGISKSDYETVRVGMHLVDAIKRGVVDAGIGFSNFHQIELEESVGEAGILRIDELADLGCCCFCSIQIITHESFLQNNPKSIQKFLYATQRAATLVTQSPELAWEILCKAQPQMNTESYYKIFLHTLPFFSRNLLNVERDWNKVYAYTQSIGLHAGELNKENCYTNSLISTHPYATHAPVVT